MLLILVSLVLTLSIDIAPDFVSHHNSTLGVCSNDTLTGSALWRSDTTLILLNVLSALSSMLFNIAIFEFICSQSPYSMTGQLIGMFYATRGLFQLLATALIVPFLSCFHGNRLIYLLLNIVIGVIVIIVYIYIHLCF